MRLEKAFLEFLSLYCEERPPLLLGLSGGPDSTALFYLLLQEGYPFEVAHVDHGWRAESGQEAEYLKKICEQKGVPFHLKRLKPFLEEKNLEDRARKARLAFFKAVLEQRHLKGVFLAHQGDDQAETVLKRLFEGASLPKLKGLAPFSQVEGIPLYRPLLRVRKEEILAWLHQKKVPYFTDPTNADSRFLRSRFRKEIVPALSAHFRKEITPSLCRIGEAAAELNRFLESLMTPYLEHIVETESTITLHFQQTPPLFLWKAILKEFFDRQRLSLSQSLLETLLFHLQNPKGRKSLKIGKQVVVVEKKKVTLSRC